MELGERLKAWLAARGMSQRQLAAKIGVSPAAVTAYIKAPDDDDSCEPSFAVLCKIAEALGVTLAEFFGPVPKPKKVRAKAVAA